VTTPPHDRARADGADEVGSVGQEALRLLRALSTPAAAETVGGETGGADDHACPNGWCPVCGVVAFVRDNPEAVQQVTDSAATMLRAMRDLYDAAVNPPDHARPAGAPSDGEHG